MKKVFADTLYWIAIVRPDDEWKVCAMQARKRLGEATLITTDEVLTEFLAGLSKSGPRLRKGAVKMVRRILDNDEITVIPQTRSGFLAGIDRYEHREDKQYSQTDCVSMNVMNSLSIQEALTNDHHFEQEGFAILIK